MNKLKLDLDRLAVETFAPTPRPRTSGGTVLAHEWGPTVPSCPSLNLCPTEQGFCPVTGLDAD